MLCLFRFQLFAHRFLFGLDLVGLFFAAAAAAAAVAALDRPFKAGVPLAVLPATLSSPLSSPPSASSSSSSSSGSTLSATRLDLLAPTDGRPAPTVLVLALLV